MEVCFVVTFRPQEVREYSEKLFVMTEREKFVVTVSAVGHRAVLDFPDKVGITPTQGGQYLCIDRSWIKADCSGEARGG